MVLAGTLAIVLVLLAVFQLALALGAPWGRFAWGGQHPGVLPPDRRIASGASVVLLLAFALFALDLGSVIDAVPNIVAQIGIWVAFALFAANVVLNAISRSPAERFAMTPAALVAAVLALLVALAGPVPQTLSGLVVDSGQGPPRLCTGPVIAIYPPVCDGPESIELEDWDWSSIEHQQEQAIRFGHYAVTGIRDGETLRVVAVD